MASELLTPKILFCLEKDMVIKVFGDTELLIIAEVDSWRVQAGQFNYSSGWK